MPYYLCSFNALFVLSLWIAAAPAIYPLGLPVILVGLFAVGFFDPFIERRGPDAAGSILCACAPAALLVVLLGITGRLSASRLWPGLLVGLEALISYLLGVLVGSELAARSQRIVLQITGDLPIDSGLPAEIAGATQGKMSIEPARGVGTQAVMLASIADDATAPSGAERRSLLRGVPCRVYRFKRDSPEETAEVAAEADPQRLYETSLGRIPVELARLYGDDEWKDPSGPIGRFLMRLLDILIAAAAILLLSPLFLIAAVAVWLEDRGPAVLRQIRIGRNGKPFVLYKFRTMKQDGFDKTDPNSNMESRILRVGRLMRKTHVDETLQFFNVVRGTMSLVGPRPELPVYHERGCREIPAYRRRLGVRPGITGWAQVRFPHTTSVDEYRVKTSYDLWYIRNRSGWVNVAILLLTVRAVLFGTGK